MRPEDVRVLMRRNILELWAGGREELIAEFFVEDCVDHMPVPGQAAGHAGLRQVLRAFHHAFPDQTMELHGVLADGDFGVDFWTFSGTHTGDLPGIPATGRPVRFSGIDVARIAAGRITEIWHVEDMAALWRQLGIALPA